MPNDCVGALSDQPGGATPINVQVLDCTPVSASLAPVPRTGQTTIYAAGDDGALQKGVAWPTPRFTDNNNGTITDNLTGLIWLKNASCFGTQVWDTAITSANGLANGQCGLSDGSVAGDWRLPNRHELESLLDLGTNNPPLPPGHTFINIRPALYWSSTTFGAVGGSAFAWYVDILEDGRVNILGKMNPLGVTAVRGGS